ncbi:MAG: hypothetical protein ACRDJ4_14900 [Actinomycetota bacterium]
MRALVAAIDEQGVGGEACRRFAERLTGEGLPPGAAVVTLGAEAPAERIPEIIRLIEGTRPDMLILVTSAALTARTGAVRRRAVRMPALGSEEAQPTTAPPEPSSIGDILAAADAAGLSPSRVLAFEITPGGAGATVAEPHPGSPGFDQTVHMVRREVGRLPLFDLADRVRAILARLRSRMGREAQAASPAFRALADLIAHLAVVELEGRWGRSLELRDRLRAFIVAGQAGPEMDWMDHLEWALVWALLEEMDRLQRAEGEA